MASKTETIHILACPAARRALRQNNPRVTWCRQHVTRLLEKKVEFSDQQMPGYKSPGVVSLFNPDDPFDSSVLGFSVTTMRSRLYHNQPILLISTYHSQPSVEDFDRKLLRCKPVSLS